MPSSGIQLVNFEEELTRLWDKEEGKNKIRACLFNLIIFTQKALRDGFYHELIKSVISKFPSRVIWITSDDAAKEEYLRSSVSSETFGEGEQQIFCEIIHIEVAGTLIERVPFLVLPEILPDLPVYLLWTQDPSKESAVLPRLEPFATRIIFDSEASTDLQEFCRSVLSLLEKFHCEVGDLNWTALSGWRKILSEVFATSESLPALAQSKSIEIIYNKIATQFYQHNQFEAAYMQGWLAAQMAWKFCALEGSQGNLRLQYKSSDREISILLIPREIASLPPGSLLQMEIHSSINNAHFCLKRKEKSRQVEVQYSDDNRCDLPFYAFLPGIAEGQEIIEEIFYQPPSAHYRNMLRLVAQIPWKQVL